MPNLLAYGPDPNHRWERELPPRPVTLGRTPTDSDWVTPWDVLISRRHATLTWKDGRLQVRREPKALNQIFFNGKPLEEFSIGIGEQFMIGKTTFVVRDEFPTQTIDLPPPYTEVTCNAQELREIKYPDADVRIAVLAELPSVIRYAQDDDELTRRVVSVLLRGIARAETAAVVQLREAIDGHEPQIDVAYSERRDLPAGDARLRPSRRLVVEAVNRQRQSVLHIWRPDRSTADPPSDYTRPRKLSLEETYPDHSLPAGSSVSHLASELAGFDWAICVPMPDDPSPGWAVYVTGRLPLASLRGDETLSEQLLKGDMKFTELVADLFGSLRQIRYLRRRQDRLVSFMSRPVLAALAEQDIDEVLRPREVEVTVLFCDLRGSCRIADDSQDDLSGLWARVSAALGIMTSSIIDFDGVIGDFQGDAAMGFWGWPLESPDQVEMAARAALIIRKRFVQVSQQKVNPLAGFNCGIGIANGRAFAGQLGTLDQTKISVYGPIVNLASRLESMTKQFQVPILLDESTAQRLGNGSNAHWCRIRPVARIQPLGMRTIQVVSELLPPAVEPTALSENDRRNYEAAFKSFLAGRWTHARLLLQRLPNDGPSRFLTGFMARNPAGPPAGWSGVIELDSK